jgi:hypothetical protein
LARAEGLPQRILSLGPSRFPPNTIELHSHYTSLCQPVSSLWGDHRFARRGPFFVTRHSAPRLARGAAVQKIAPDGARDRSPRRKPGVVEAKRDCPGGATDHGPTYQIVLWPLWGWMSGRLRSPGLRRGLQSGAPPGLSERTVGDDAMYNGCTFSCSLGEAKHHGKLNKIGSVAASRSFAQGLEYD